MIDLMRDLLTEEAGQGMAEYSLLLALIALAVTATLSTLGNSIEHAFDKAAGLFES